MPARGIEKLVKIVSDPGIILDDAAAITEAVDALRPDGPSGILELAELIRDLLAARSPAIGYALAVADKMPPENRLIEALREVTTAQALATRTRYVRFASEISGAGQVGWTNSTHQIVIKRASEILSRLESALRDTSGEPSSGRSPIPSDALVVYKPYHHDIQQIDYLRSLDYSPSTNVWLFHHALYPDDRSTHWAKPVSAEEAYQFLLENRNGGITSYRENCREALERNFSERLRQDNISFPDRLQKCPGCNGEGWKGNDRCRDCMGDGWIDAARFEEVRKSREAERMLRQGSRHQKQDARRSTSPSERTFQPPPPLPKPWWKFW